MDAREIESLSMLQRGFADLKDANPELAYNVILDILAGINDNQSIRQHISTTKGLFPHKRITRESKMTAKGLVVVEHEEGVGESSTPSTPSAIGKRERKASESETPRKGPIAELLYMRWLDGIRLKWPSPF
jgi:serine/threonine-protein kinase 24/25/MST4